MNDCLAATGSTGIDPLIGAIALLLLGVGIGAVVWKNRKRDAVGIALLPLVLGILVFGNVSATPAQAAECPPPPAACVPVEVESITLESPAEVQIRQGDSGPYVDVDGLSPEDVIAFQEFLLALSESGGSTAYYSTATFRSGETTVTLTLDITGGIVSSVPALPEDFDDQDVWDLIEETLDQFEDVPVEVVLSYDYETGCGPANASITISGTWTYPEIIVG